MRTNINFLLLLCMATGLTACAKAYQNSTVPTQGQIVQHGSGLPQASVSQTSIQGNWKNTCTKDAKTRGYFTSTIAIQNAVITVDTISYADAACVYPISEENRVSNFSITVATDVTTLTETMATLSYKPLNAVIAQVFNTHSFCGITSWIAGSAETVTSASVCAGAHPTSAFHVQLYGSQELYLDTCANTSDTNCISVRFTKN
jgi:hypothetical protein